MPSRFWKRQESSSKAHPARRLAVSAIAAVALLGAVLAGIRLGNSAIGDINPVHFRGAPVHPRDRGAAVSEQVPRASEPAYATLYGWDEGREARAEACPGCGARLAAETRGFDDGLVEAQLREPVRSDPNPVRVTIHRGKDGVDRYDYQRNDVFLNEPPDEPRRPARRQAGATRSAIDDADRCRRGRSERACRGGVGGARQRDAHSSERPGNRLGEDADVDLGLAGRERERVGDSVILE